MFVEHMMNVMNVMDGDYSRVVVVIDPYSCCYYCCDDCDDDCRMEIDKSCCCDNLLFLLRHGSSLVHFGDRDSDGRTIVVTVMDNGDDDSYCYCCGDSYSCCCSGAEVVECCGGAIHHELWRQVVEES